MAITRNPDGTLNIIKCMGYCQNNSDKICGKGCRNIGKKEISNELFFSDESIATYSQVESNEKYFKSKVENILKNLY